MSDEWTTGQRPTKEDADEHGNVWVKSHAEIAYHNIFHWSIVAPDMLWRKPPGTPEPIPPAEPWPLPRLFAAPIRRTFTPSGRMVLDAIADDGTAWAVWIDSAIEASAIRWHQIPPLPQPEAE